MPITNLRNRQTGNMYIDRSVEAVRWLPIPTYTSQEGGDPITIAVTGYLQGDVQTVATQGSFNSSVFAVTGANREMVVTATPRADVAFGQQIQDTITLRATGVTVNSITPAPVDNSFTVVTFDASEPKIFWSGSPGRSVNEGTTTNIGLSQYIRGIPDNTFDSVSFVTAPTQNWITLTDANSSMANLRIVAPQVTGTMNIPVALRVTKSTAMPTTDDTTAVITVLDLNPTGDAGIAVERWNVPEGVITAGTFMASVKFTQELAEGDTLVVSDLYIDGLTGVTITSVTVNADDATTYDLVCTADQNIIGVATIGLV